MKRTVLAQAIATARGAGIGVSRADRVTGRRAAAVPLAALADWPRWPALSPDARAAVWRVAALIAARDAVSDVIDGATLRTLADAVGENELEAVLALPPGGDAPLPPATLLAEHGRRLAEAALPPPLAAAMQVTGGDPAAARALAQAEAIAA